MTYKQSVKLYDNNRMISEVVYLDGVREEIDPELLCMDDVNFADYAAKMIDSMYEPKEVKEKAKNV